MFAQLKTCTLICLLGSLISTSALAGSYSWGGRNYRLADWHVDVSAIVPNNVLTFTNIEKQPKSYGVALAYAMFPGYFIPAAFGHAYADAKWQAGIISATRLSGRIMWMYSFFENIMGDQATGQIQGGDATYFIAGLVMDIGGYLYDTLHVPFEIAAYNRHLGNKNSITRISPFVDMVNDSPCCGIEVKF